jgi:hypothetical protein
LEAQIQRVITGLHVRESVESVPGEKWSLVQRMTHYRVPAVSIAVIHDGKIQWARAFGRAFTEKRQKVSPTTMFQAASISKALTAFAVLRLVDQGLLALDTPVNTYLRNWKFPDGDAGYSDSVTVARLMAHMVQAKEALAGAILVTILAGCSDLGTQPAAHEVSPQFIVDS